MKRIIWGLFIFIAFITFCSAKDKYIVKIDVNGENINIKKNLAFLNVNYDISKYEFLENGLYLFNSSDSEDYNSDKIYELEIPKKMKDTEFSFIFTIDEDRFKTDNFKCNFIRDDNEDYVCYHEYNVDEGLIKDITNISIMSNVVCLLKDDILAIAIVLVALVLLAYINNIYIKKLDINKNIGNIDSFYIIFLIAVLAINYVLYVLDIFNLYNLSFTTSLILNCYFTIYYINKLIVSRKAGLKGIALLLLSYFLLVGVTILSFLWI